MDIDMTATDLTAETVDSLLIELPKLIGYLDNTTTLTTADCNAYQRLYDVLNSYYMFKSRKMRESFVNGH